MKRGSSTTKGGFGTQQTLPSRPFGGFGTHQTTSTLSYLAEPPSLSAISNPHLVVLIKNILKKDSTTKGRALEELLGHVQVATEEVEDSVLDVWTRIYPRISIDNSRRVRELSHNLQLELLKSCRKRMERRLSGIVATWIAGSFDRDRAVARAATIGLSSFLNTPEKLTAFWLKCQPQILDFAIEAIRETPDTLSDERSTTRDDADAKYFRVVHASLCLVLGLLQRAPADSLAKHEAQYEDYFSAGTVWQLIEAPDSAVRKAVCHLMFACLDRGLSYVDTSQSRLAFVNGGLRSSQSGSALEYIRALTKFTQSNPKIWTGGKGKKTPMDRLLTFIAKGSQGSPPRFWEQVESLIQVLPNDPDEGMSLKYASDLLISVQSGITNREEPKTNTSMAWKCYIDTAKRLLTGLSPSDQLLFASEHMFPLFDRFIFSTTGSAGPIPLGPNAMTIFVEAHSALAQGSPELRSTLITTWDQLASTFCTNIAGVLPEVSKDFKTSQDSLSEQGRRWFGLVGEVHAKNSDAAGPSSILVEPSKKIISHCLQLLGNRNLKPYGVACVVEFALSSAKHLFEGDVGSQCLNFLSSVASNDMQLVINSSSASTLISSLRLLRNASGSQRMASEVWDKWITLILESPPSLSRNNAITLMISSEDVSKAAQDTPALQSEMKRQLCEAGTDVNLLMDAAIKYDALASTTVTAIATELIQRLVSDRSDILVSLNYVEQFLKSHKKLFLEDETIHTSLIRQLLALKETQDPDVSTKASRLRSLLGEGSTNTLSPVVSIIQQNLETAGPQCLSIDTLVQQAQDAFNGGVSEEDIFPSTNSFMKSLVPFLERAVDPSLAIMTLPGDAALLTSPSSDSIPHRPPPRDAKGRSIPARMALYVCHLLNRKTSISALPTKFQVELLYIHALVTQLTSDQISVNSVNGLWASLESPEALNQAEWLVSTSRRQMLDLTESCTDWSGVSEVQSNVMPQVVQLLAQESADLTPTALYSSRALGEIFQAVVEKRGIPASWEQRFLGPDVLKAAPDTVLLAAVVLSGMGTSLQPSKSVNTLCNRLASDIAASKVPNKKSAMLLSLMALCGTVYDGALPIASNRVVFAVKQITDWFEDCQELSPELASASLRSLAQLLPCMREVYGSFWEKTLQFCVKSWERARVLPLPSVIPLLHASLKLTKELEEIEDANDDLEEALFVFSKQKGAAFVGLLRLDRDFNTQPLNIVDRLLFRELEKLTTSQLPEAEELYGLVAADSETIQTAAYTMLHRIIPEQQQQLSVDILLDKGHARLPDELLSLLLDAPTLEQFSDEMLATFPLSVRGYLLSWKLIFDAYGASPLKIRQDFTEGVKADDLVSPLLDFLFDVLGHSAGYPLKLDKEGITKDQIKNFDIKLAEAEPEEKSMHWLMCNIFYLTLKYLPGLFRRWYQESRSKQTKQAVGSWTETFFSSLIIEDVLDDVQKWVDGDGFEAPGEAEVTVKIAKAAKEISVLYEIDESQGGICIKLPNNFPIDGVAVRGIRRVAVDERKWQNWIMTTQAVITFANSNIIDGIHVFRRNLTGALQGHTECAICYSVISSDQRLPEKNCTTCKNLFHRLCLYKWFQTSNNNTCPLCRTPIDFAGAGMQKRKA